MIEVIHLDYCSMFKHLVPQGWLFEDLMEEFIGIASLVFQTVCLLCIHKLPLVDSHKDKLCKHCLVSTILLS